MESLLYEEANKIPVMPLFFLLRFAFRQKDEQGWGGEKDREHLGSGQASDSLRFHRSKWPIHGNLLLFFFFLLCKWHPLISFIC